MEYQPRIGARVRTKPRNWMGQFQKVQYGTVVANGDTEGFVIVEYDDGLLQGNHFTDLALSLFETLRSKLNE